MKTLAPYFVPAALVVGAVGGAAATCITRNLVGPGQVVPTFQLVTAIIAGLAFCAALVTIGFNWRKSKKDLFISMHEKLIDPEAQGGRKILSKKVDGKDSVSDLETSEFESANRALALYDTLAMYSLRGSVIKADVMETWGLPIHRRAPQIRAFIAYRAEEDKYKSWPHLTAMLDELDKNPPKDK